MRLKVYGRRIRLTDALHNYVIGHIGSALDRVADNVEEIVVRISELNGPRGSARKHCQVFVILTAGESFILESRDTDAYRAIDHTACRLKRIVNDSVKR